MLYSKLFAKTTKTDPKDEISINAKLLLKGGFVDKLMAGSYTLLPLGLRVKEKIEQIVREEMNKTGAQELLMPLLHPKEIWNETGRWERAKEIMYQFKKDDKEYALSFTHEEIVLDLVRKHSFSYKDFPVKIYHFSTKFRNELRAKSGLLRCREFLMKDLYSLHTSAEDLDKYYWEVAEAYKKIFKKLGVEAKIVEAAGGVFTDNITHEFQVLCETGEDTIFYCDGKGCGFAQNKEIAVVKTGDKCKKCAKVGHDGTIHEARAIEVGNIFRFGTVYSEKMNVSFTDSNGKKQFAYLGSYGIGVTRTVGALVEVYHDNKGIIWPETVAPYQIHLVGLNLNEAIIKKQAEELYKKIKQNNVEVLYDDREDVSAGEKFSDADLIGIPRRLVVSKKTGDKIEYKKRDNEKVELLTLEQVLNKFKTAR